MRCNFLSMGCSTLDQFMIGSALEDIGVVILSKDCDQSRVGISG